jgi:peptidoglycan-associated lipoprotein
MSAATLLLFIAATGCGKSQVVSEGETTPPAPKLAEAVPAVAPEPAPVAAPAPPAAPPAAAVAKAPPPPPAVPAPVKTAPRLELQRIHFEFDQAALRQDARDILNSNAEQLSRNASGRIRIEGHCDERGTAEYNLALGDRRAKNAYQYLVDLGVGADRLDVVSYGNEVPLVPDHDETAWAQNRRVEFVAVLN